MKNSRAKQAIPIIVLTLVVFIAVTVLSYTHDLTKGAIENQKWAKIESVLNQIFPAYNNYNTHAECEDICVIYDESDNLLGYAFLATGKGYGGDIEILVGLKDPDTVKGIVIISHSETPGLGSRITEDDFRAKFVNIPISNVDLTANGGTVDGLTGATISSTATVNAVREAALEMIEFIK